MGNGRVARVITRSRNMGFNPLKTYRLKSWRESGHPRLPTVHLRELWPCEDIEWQIFLFAWDYGDWDEVTKFECEMERQEQLRGSSRFQLWGSFRFHAMCWDHHKRNTSSDYEAMSRLIRVWSWSTQALYSGLSISVLSSWRILEGGHRWDPST